MNAPTLVGLLTTSPNTRTTRLGRQVTSTAVNVAGEYLDGDSNNTISVNIHARGAAAKALAECGAGDLVVLSGYPSYRFWRNRKGRSSEQWSMAVRSIERVLVGSDAAFALGYTEQPA